MWCFFQFKNIKTLSLYLGNTVLSESCWKYDKQEYQGELPSK